MPTLLWSDELTLKQPRMDATHHEFVELLAALEAAADAGLTDGVALKAMTEHTEAHFAQEERWMAALGFAPENCHTSQHGSVLQVVREVWRRHGVGQADAELLKNLVSALAEWFPIHATMMDAALAEVMAERGYDPETGAAAQPVAAEEALITGCGGGSCG